MDEKRCWDCGEKAVLSITKLEQKDGKPPWTLDYCGDCFYDATIYYIDTDDSKDITDYIEQYVARHLQQAQEG